MHGQTFIFVENFHVNNLSVVLEIFDVFNFRGQGYPRKLFNLEHFPIYGIFKINLFVYFYNFKIVVNSKLSFNYQ